VPRVLSPPSRIVAFIRSRHFLGAMRLPCLVYQNSASQAMDRRWILPWPVLSQDAPGVAILKDATLKNGGACPSRQ